ncbi:hypothetical protein, partial [Marichromatium gracile]|uniref:hypothetical protein n=1 Tax=Marichromatium gracile TaxID=1048 RepID=UPI001A90E2A9
PPPAIGSEQGHSASPDPTPCEPSPHTPNQLTSLSDEQHRIGEHAEPLETDAELRNPCDRHVTDSLLLHAVSMMNDWRQETHPKNLIERAERTGRTSRPIDRPVKPTIRENQ